MKEGPDIASLGALIGDPARANMLAALMSGLALTAGELAREAGVTPQTASAHLLKLAESRLVMMEVQGRHRYFRIAGPEVAQTLEGLMELASRTGRPRTRPGPCDEMMRRARVCYDHLAGERAVRLFDAFLEREFLVASREGLGLSRAGRAWLCDEGVDVVALEAKSRPLCRACLDWSERRNHLAGSVGAAMLNLIFARKWAMRDGASRAIAFTRSGERDFEAMLGGGGRVACEA